MKYKLENIAEYVNEKIKVSKIENGRYISTENMLPNKNGIVRANKELNLNKVNYFKKGDILISNIRPYFKKIWYATFDGGCSNDVLIIRVKDQNMILSRYLYYLLSEDKFFKYIMSGSKGTKKPRGDKKQILRYIIKVPTLKEQNKIVNIMDVICKKIELNNQINNNLYELSRTIFNELYKKSENWQGCKIQDIGLYVTDYVANGSFKSLADNVKIYNTKNYALFVRNTDLKVNFTQERKYVDEHSYKFLNKSKLIGRELIISNVGDVGSVYLCPSYKIPMTLGNNIIMVNSKGLRVNYNYYLYYFFLSIAGQYLIDGITGGSAQQKFNKTDFRNSIIKIPSDDEIVEFNKKIIPLYDIIEKNIMENETLSKLRDTLLPKLMNGEINLDKIEC